MVAAKTAKAAEAGVAMLRAGGNAVDAAVATAFAAGVAEPWMNGLGGGGYLVAHLPIRDETVVVEYPMVAPAAATPGMFPLSGAGFDGSLFGWPATEGNANVVGHRAAAIPGTVAGLALALDRYGTLPLTTVMEPAITLAEDGVPITWHTTLTIARDLANLRRFPATAAVFLDIAGNPPSSIEQTNLPLLRQFDLAKTLRQIAADGPAAFYEGEFAAAAVQHLGELGGLHSLADYADYTANVVPALTVPYRAANVHTVGNGSGGTSLGQTLRLLAALDLCGNGPNSPATLHLLAQAFGVAFADRFAYLADPEHVDVPLEALLSADYANERAEMIDQIALDGRPRAGDRDRLDVAHDLPASVPEYVADGSTTHLGAIDRDGNVVSLTQTLLSGWGSRVVVPGTGVLLNNGMMWFDPEPGRPNSVAGGKRPLSNMAPAIVTGQGWSASIGASGGRKIQNCIAQLVVNLVDFEMGMQEAISAPRIDASDRSLAVSARLPIETRERLAALGHDLSVRDEHLFTGDFASPVGIHRAADGTLTGGADPFYFPATVIGLDD